MVGRFHAAGIEVILDVVYNHTAEGDELGARRSASGASTTRSYYRLAGGGRHYVNDTGTGNTLNLTHPMVLRMVMDSLRYWVEVGHVDGFRFDLATVLGREAHGFDPNGGFFRRDPAGPGPVPGKADRRALGYRSRRLSAGRLSRTRSIEWNDRFRDGVRRFWRGDAGMTRDLADADTRHAPSGSTIPGGRRPLRSTSSPAMTASRLKTWSAITIKRNLANGEDNRDGHHENHSDNLGIEGPTKDPQGSGRPCLAQAQPAGHADAVPGHADDPGGGRDRPQPGRQQQRLCPGQRDQLDRLGRRRTRTCCALSSGWPPCAGRCRSCANAASCMPARASRTGCPT